MSGGDDPWVSVTNANHYVLDGVPMRISEGFRPKTKQRDPLPALRFNPGQSKVLSTKYEFETENGYIQWYGALLVEQERSEKEKVERKLAQEAAAAAAARERKEVDSSSTPVTAASQHALKCEVIVPVVSNSILQPERASPVTVASSTSQPQSTAVNLRDFENLSEDPFDNMELKTINEMKELESVLSNSQQQQALAGTQIHSVSTVEQSERSTPPVAADEPVYENPVDVITRPTESTYENCNSMQPSLLNLDKKKGPRPSPRIKNNLNGETCQPLALFNCKSEEVIIDKPGVHGSEHSSDLYVNIPAATVHSKPHLPIKPPPAIKPKPKVDTKVDNTSKPAAGLVDGSSKSSSKVQSLANNLSKQLDGAIGRPPGAPKGFSYVSPATNSNTDNKEVKDIEWPSLEQRSLPPTPSEEAPSDHGTAALIKTSYEPSKLNNLNKKAVPIEPPASATNYQTNGNGGAKRVPGRKAPPRPAALPSQQKQKSSTDVPSNNEVIHSLLSMGFEKVHITAALKHIGADTKKVVDHIFAVNQLVSGDIKWLSAHQALIVCGSDLTKAEKFAKGYQQLSEFGFGDDVIKEALISCDMDMQAALDKLVS